MPAKPPRPPLPSLTFDDDGEGDRIRDYARAKGLVATSPPAEAPARAEPGTRAEPPAGRPAPERAAPQAAPPRPAVPRPAPTRPWQAMFPDYLIDQLKRAAAEAGTAQKVVVLDALRQAGFRVDDIDLQDLRRR
ncbi:MAG: hypothetical protein GVY09_12605 [Gammaproteobacteria bacterium]|jgi:hypothetical protein|nr:hypothetical protein [Gammaproteobacteria bacterium]